MLGNLRKRRRRKGAGIARSIKFEPLEQRCLLSAGPLRISEFLADNDGGLRDVDRAWSDWIEIYNPTTEPVDLSDWYLTDNADNLTKWQFPEVTIEPFDYLTVFASEKDYTDPLRQLHTDFKLSAGGEYLALVYETAEETLVISDEFAPTFPPQFPNISYGDVQAKVTLLADDAPLVYLVPDAGHADLATDWTESAFDDSQWTNSLLERPVLITEAGDGKPDWFEIQNVASYRADTEGWVVAVNWGKDQDIGDSNTTVWHLPDSIGAGEVLYRTDSTAPENADVYFQDNIWWTTGKGGWVMIVDDEGQVADFLAWGYEQAEIESLSTTVNGFEISLGDAWSGPACEVNDDQAKTFRRVGIADDNAAGDFVLDAASSMGLPNPDLQTPFQGSGGPQPTLGVGFSTTETDFGDLVGTNIVREMHDQNASVWLRVPFEVDDPTALDLLTLRMRYEDGFVAYINGVEVAQDNAPAALQWNSSAMGNRPIELAGDFEDFNIPITPGLLQAGTNMLAILGLNDAAADGEFLIAPRLTATGKAVRQSYMPASTPGNPNGLGFELSGPMITELPETLTPPSQDEDLTITARVVRTENPVDRVTLHYRVMFGADIPMAMTDNGIDGDAVAGDGVYSATIPSAVLRAGQMIRWYVTATDTLENQMRFPLFLDPEESPEYFGTIVDNPTIESNLPVLHWFVKNANAAATDAGTRASIYYEGEFYDNIQVDIHGQSTRGFSKKSYDLDFNSGYRLQYSDDQPPVKDFNLLTNWADKSKVRNTLAYEVFAAAGVTHHVAFPVRVEQNGRFFSTADWVEDGDDVFLERLDLDPEGALYKMYNRLDSTSGGEKKTRKFEGKTDLQQLVSGLASSGSTRTRYIYDNIDVPAVINFLAAVEIVDTIDLGHKNYYVYRDTNGSGQWQMTPWDVDLSFGRNWTGSYGYYDDKVYTNNPLYIHHDNRLMRAMFELGSDFREMYLRRVRTLMDELLQAPGTPYGERVLEQRIDELVGMIDPNEDIPSRGFDDADLDYRKWGTWTFSGSTASGHTMRQDVDRIKNEYLPARRDYLFNTLTVGADGTRIPDAQIDLAALPAEQRRIEFGTIDFAPASGNQDEEFLQIRNRNPFAIDLSGWQLADGVEFTFKPGTVILPGGTLYVSPDINAFQGRSTGPSGGRGLLVLGGYQGHLSSFGETIELRDANGLLITSKTYEGNPSDQQLYLRITEVMYHPAEPSDDEIDGDLSDKNLFEYIELMNIGPAPISLAGAHFTRGITFTFPDMTLEPNQRILVVANESAFEMRYGTGLDIAGQFESGRLDNSGESVKLEDSDNGTINQFSYDDGGAWPGRADGAGAALEIIDPAGDDSEVTNWRATADYLGSPGLAGMTPIEGLVVNEVVAQSDLPDVDWFELFNATETAVDIGGWYVSDTSNQFKKYRIPDGTLIAAGAYRVFSEEDFNPAEPVAGQTPFALNSIHGDDVWLMEADEQGNLTRFADHADFRASAAGEAFGLWPNAVGRFVPMVVPTPGAANSGPRVGPVLISEIMYHPTGPGGSADPDDFEFVELYNPLPTSVDLTDWQLDGAVEFDFPTGTELASGATLVVVPFDMTDAAELNDFRNYYALDATVRIVGGYRGKLDNSGERLKLLRPGILEPGELPYRQLLLEDEVKYDDLEPWPVEADGGGQSLVRLATNLWGDDHASWNAAAPTPGSADLQIADDAYEPNDSSDEAFDLGPAEASWLSSIAGPAIQANADWYRIDPAAGPMHLIVDLTFAHASGNIDVELIDSSAAVWETAASDTDGEHLETVVPQSGEWFLRIHGDNAGNAYNLRWESVYRHPGDANLDGSTDLSDFNIWNANKFTQGANWTEGDFNGDGNTDLSDFNIWNAYKFTQAPSPVPEEPERVRYVDAAMQQRLDLATNDLGWLLVAESSETDHGPSHEKAPAEEIVDRLLATFWN